MIDRAYFVASKVGVPDLRFLEHLDELDHGWHEAYSFQTTNEEATDKQHRSIEEFLRSVRSATAA